MQRQGLGQPFRQTAGGGLVPVLQLAMERLERTQRLGVRRAVVGALEALAMRPARAWPGTSPRSRACATGTGWTRARSRKAFRTADRSPLPPRWCADAGRPTRFKPSSPSPTDAVRDGSAKLGHPVQNVTREHGLTPLPRLNCVPEDSRRRSTCTGRTHSPRARADGHQTPSSTVAGRAPSPS